MSDDMMEQIKKLCPKTRVKTDKRSGDVEFLCDRASTPRVCQCLAEDHDFQFAGLVVEERKEWELNYIFSGVTPNGRAVVKTKAPLDDREFESVSVLVHAADWHEREAEDLFGLVFKGHPRLGDFILHDDVWQEGVEPMRRAFKPETALSSREPRDGWRPRKIVDVPGGFIMPIGPVFSGDAESVHFQLETIGEEVMYAFPRLFFKYRGVEKIVEGRSAEDALLLVERFAGTTAFSHALAFSMAVERLAKADIPERAKFLRVFLAELERFRSHLSTINAICASTGLAVGASQTAILEEKALRISGALTGHRYLFGLAALGGLTRDFDKIALHTALDGVADVLDEAGRVENLLVNTSSFLDRLEEVGAIERDQAVLHGLVGPVARASGYLRDLRETQPYAAYDKCGFKSVGEVEGDGYARLRVLFREIERSVEMMKRVVAELPDGPCYSPVSFAKGAAFAGVETPRGAAWHWVRMDKNGKIERCRLATPSFTNWHGFHLAAENFAFQDFPIILATFGLSVAENDR